MILLKHASNVPPCALGSEDVFNQAGFLPGVFQPLLIGSDQVVAVIEDARGAAFMLGIPDRPHVRRTSG